MTKEIIVLILGAVSSITLILSALSTHKPRLLILGLITTSLVATQYSINGALVGFGACLISLIRNSTVLASYKISWLNHWSLIPVFMIAHTIMFSFMNDWSKLTVLSFVPLVASLFGVVAIYFENLIYTKSILLLVGSMWLIYEFTAGAYGQMAGETFTLGANTIALILLIKAAKTGSEVIEPSTKIIHTITSSVPAITNNIKTLTGSMKAVKTSHTNTMTNPVTVID